MIDFTRKVARSFAAVAVLSLALVSVSLGVGTPTASAKHAQEAVTVSKTSGLSDGDVVKVSVSGYTPNARPVKVVIAGQGTLVTIPDKLNFAEYASAPTIPIAADGTGSIDYTVIADHGIVQDGTTLDCNVNDCWIIAVQEPFLPQPNYNSAQIYFGNTGPAATTPPPTAPPATAAPTTAPPTTAAPTTTAKPTTTTTTTTSTTTTTTTVEPEEIALASIDTDDSGSGPMLAMTALIITVVGSAGYFFTRRKPAA